MAKIVKGARFISKYANSTNIKPTIPVNSTKSTFQNDDHTIGWNSTDIYVGEWYFNIYDSKVYFRTTEGIYEVIAVQSKDNNGVTVTDKKSKISASYLPGNYLGAMVFKGSWDANLNEPELGTTVKAENGDYYIVNVSGTTSLPSGNVFINEWNVGDFAVYTDSTTGWEKIDNSERQEYANMVIYENNFNSRPNTYFPTKNTVQMVLDNVYEQLYLTPTFNNPSTFNKPVTVNGVSSTNTKQILKINGNTTTTNRLLHLSGNTSDKWITFNGVEGSTGNGTLKIGSEGYTNTILEFGPYGIATSPSIPLTSTVNFNYSSALSRTKRWSIYSSPTDAYIKGYTSNGTDELIKLTLNNVDNSFIKSKLIIGNVSNTAISDLQVNSTSNSNLAITRSNTALANNLEIGKLSFYLADNSTTFNEYIKITGKIADDSTNNSTLVLSLRGNSSSTPVDALILKGTNTGFYLGINKGAVAPTAPLDVNGNAIVSGNFTLGTNVSTHNINGTVLINNDISVYGVLNSIKTTSSDIFTLRDNTTTISSLSWLNSSKTIQVKGNLGNTHITYDTLNGNLTLNTSKLYLLNTDLEFTTASKNVDFNNALVTRGVFDNVSFNEITSYNITYTYSEFSDNDLINKKSLVDYVATHAVGLWSSGQTVNQYVAYDLGQTKYVGVNTNNPQYNLHVIGNTKLTDTLYTTNIILNSDQQERFIRTDVYGGAIRFRGNYSSTTDRNLMFGCVDNSNNFTNIMTLNTNNYNVSIGANADTSTYKLFIDGTLRTSGIMYASTLNVGTTNSKATSLGLYVDGKTKLNNNVGIGTDPSINYKLNVSGNTLFSGNLDVLTSVYINTQKTFLDTYALRVNGTSKFDSKVIIKGNTPNIIANTDLYSGGNAYVFRLNIGNETDFTQYKLNVSGNAYIQDRIGINGYNTNYRLFVNGSIYSTAIDVNGIVKSSTYTSYTQPTAYYLKLDDSTTSLRIPGSILTNSSLVLGNINQTPITNGLYVHGKTYLNDNVGISTPPDGTGGYKLLVNGNMRVYGDINNYGSIITTGYLSNSYVSTGYIGLGVAPDSNYKIKANGKTYLMDNVGIGTTPTTTEKLTVNGSTYVKTLKKNKFIDYITTTTTIYSYDIVEGDIIDPINYDEYVLNIDNIKGDFNLRFSYLDFDILKNRNFEIVIPIREPNANQTSFNLNFEKLENNVPYNHSVENSFTILGTLSTTAVKMIKINFSYYDLSTIDWYSQSVIWTLSTFNVDNQLMETFGNSDYIIENITSIWTRSGTSINVMSENHGKSNGEFVHIPYSTDKYTIPNNKYQITVVDLNNFSFIAINTGNTSGKLIWE